MKMPLKVFFFPIIQSYSSSLVAFLSVPLTQSPIDTLEEVAAVSASSISRAQNGQLLRAISFPVDVFPHRRHPPLDYASLITQRRGTHAASQAVPN